MLFSFEAEKDSYRRYAELDATTILNALEHLGAIPDVVAFGGSIKGGWPVAQPHIGAGYLGAQRTDERRMNFLGKWVTSSSTTHERSHIMSAVGLAPRDDSSQRAVLVWEGGIGSFYLMDDRWAITREVGLMWGPGTRYANLFALADPTFPDVGLATGDNSGKLMALAAYGDAQDATPAIVDTVDRLLEMEEIWPFEKGSLRDSTLYNAGVEAEATKVAAALLGERMFGLFSKAAEEYLPSGIPLHIAGGCGLNCDWNMAWREHGQFSSVFVPPCPNDSGIAIGAAIDAFQRLTGDPYIDWSVYSGLEFEWDSWPRQEVWNQRPADMHEIADALDSGRIFAWVQGRVEIGPRALGNRSLIASPFEAHAKDRLNQIKKREDYRPIAPCCRLEDAGDAFTADFDDPYMLYFRMARDDRIPAVTHVDGSARCQTVTRHSNGPLHDLLSAFAEHHGIGVLCNTSLNFKGLGFINKLSDLGWYCTTQEVDDMVVGDTWFERVEPLEHARRLPALAAQS